MSGLGSGMPKSVTLVTQVTVNLLAHVTEMLCAVDSACWVMVDED